MRVFSKEKFMKDTNGNNYSKWADKWADKCDGKPIYIDVYGEARIQTEEEPNEIRDYCSCRDWEIEIEAKEECVQCKQCSETYACFRCNMINTYDYSEGMCNCPEDYSIDEEIKYCPYCGKELK